MSAESKSFLIHRDDRGLRRIDVFEPDEKKQADEAYKASGSVMVNGPNLEVVLEREAHRRLFRAPDKLETKVIGEIYWLRRQQRQRSPVKLRTILERLEAILESTTTSSSTRGR